MFYAPISKAGASGALGSRYDRFAKPRHIASFGHPLLPPAATDLIEALPQSMALVDANWVIVAANSEWTVAAVRRGYADMLAVGQCFRSFCEWLVMMGFNDGAIMLRGMAAIDEGRASEFQHQHASPRGSDRMQLSVSAFDVAGVRYASIAAINASEVATLRRERTQLSAKLFQLQAKLMRVQSEERERLGRDLHDGAAQHLTGITLELARLRQINQDPQVGAAVEQISGLLQQFQAEMRGLTYTLHPPQLGRGGLHAAIRALCEGLAGRSAIEVTLRIYGVDRMRSSAVDAAIYRVVQEALINVHRHAGARHVRVRLSDRPEALFAVIEDDGVGLRGGKGSEQPLGVGIPGMIRRINELGGRFVIRGRAASRGSGTIIGAMIPRHGRGQTFLTEADDVLEPVEQWPSF